MVEERLLTIQQAADRLGIHQNTLRQWADKGLVPVIKLPSGYRRFKPADIRKLREAMGLEGQAEARG